MAEDRFPTSWRDPNYVAGVVGTVATGALFFYSGLAESAPSPETIGFVLLWVFLPAGVAYEVARRFR
ncbi:MAG: hypothetical protein ACI8TL_000431 [Natronomonas sp.]|jgi:hypothetical protein